MTKRDPIIVGVDLAGKAENPTGWATLKSQEVSARHLFSDKEIINAIRDYKPTLTQACLYWCSGVLKWCVSLFLIN